MDRNKINEIFKEMLEDVIYMKLTSQKINLEKRDNNM